MSDTVHRANMCSTARGALQALPNLEINTNWHGGGLPTTAYTIGKPPDAPAP